MQNLQKKLPFTNNVRKKRSQLDTMTRKMLISNFFNYYFGLKCIFECEKELNNC